MAFWLYMLFVVSWLLHLTARYTALGDARFDLWLILVLGALAFARPREREDTGESSLTDRILRVLVVYVILTLPFVEWPGSVIRAGLPNFIKVVVFYYFTKGFVRTERQLKWFLAVFIGCQSFRVIEPVYLHWTADYWGSAAYIGAGQLMKRLSGAPSDVVNPNGLAYVIVTVMPFLHFLSAQSIWLKLVYGCLLPILMYALLLTGSRSGFLAAGIIVVGVLMKSQRKWLVVLIVIAGVLFALPRLSSDQADRLLSIYKSDTRNAATAQGRLRGTTEQFAVAMNKPLFGFGLGASQEANFNVAGDVHTAHILYGEVATELGFVGLALYMVFIYSIVANYVRARKDLAAQGEANEFRLALINAMQVWFIMNVLFSFATYGLSSCEWYLFAGLSVVTARQSLRAPSARSRLAKSSEVGA